MVADWLSGTHVPARTLVVAHRGLHFREGPPENTIAAFEAAIGIGAEMVEFDVRRTSDGRLIAFHDRWVRGISTSSRTHAELVAPGSRERPPLLDDVLAALAGRIAIDIELKERGYVEAILPRLRAFGLERCLLTSFLPDVVREAKRREPALATGLLLARRSRRALSVRTAAAGADCAGPALALSDARTLAAAGASMVPCIVWTVNRERELERLLRHPAVAAVITDRPALALARRAELIDSRTGDGGASGATRDADRGPGALSVRTASAAPR